MILPRQPGRHPLFFFDFQLPTDLLRAQTKLFNLIRVTRRSVCIPVKARTQGTTQSKGCHGNTPVLDNQCLVGTAGTCRYFSVTLQSLITSVWSVQPVRVGISFCYTAVLGKLVSGWHGRYMSVLLFVTLQSLVN